MKMGQTVGCHQWSQIEDHETRISQGLRDKAEVQAQEVTEMDVRQNSHVIQCGIIYDKVTLFCFEQVNIK